VRDTLFSEGGIKSSILLEGSQATPTSHSGRNNVKVKPKRERERESQKG
jgi:hypothetical protein